MAIEIRACAPSEVAAALGPIWHYFAAEPREEDVARTAPFVAPGRMLAAWDGTAAVGGAGAYSLELSVPGGSVRAAGVMGVGVLPTHRRRGILTELMRRQLDDVRASGEPLAALWASEDPIYGRYGYGAASFGGDVDLPRADSAFAQPSDAGGRVRLVEHEEALRAFPPVYDRVRRETPGMLARSTEWWERRRLADPESRRDGGGPLMRALLELEGSPQAYALYRLRPVPQHGTTVDVVEAVAASPLATREIWRLLLGIDWVASVRASLLPLDHPLFFLLAHPRRMRFRVRDGLWLRLVDVGAALAARSYAGDHAVVLDVLDPFCGWNEGRWRLEDGGASRSGDEPDVRLDAAALGSVYLGGFTFAQLARAGRVEELREGGLARADALFRADRAPWCPEIF